MVTTRPRLLVRLAARSAARVCTVLAAALWLTAPLARAAPAATAKPAASGRGAGGAAAPPAALPGDLGADPNEPESAPTVLPSAIPPVTLSAEPAAPKGPAPPPAMLNPSEIHRWDRHVRGFRREHNFALAAGVSSGTWRVKRFGPVANENFDTSGAWSKFQYTYHLPIYRGFGYLLGSSAGYYYERLPARSAFQPVPAYEFPGFIAGLVMNFTPVLRFSVASDIYLERHNGVAAHDPAQPLAPATKIAVTATAYDGGAFFDVFYDLNFALRLEAHRRHLDYQRPFIQNDGQAYGVDAAFGKDDQWLGLGLVYHLL